MKKRFLFACGSLLFSLIVAAIISLFPIGKSLLAVLDVIIGILGFALGLIFPKFGRQLTKLAVGWAISSEASGETAAEVSEELSNEKAPDEEFLATPRDLIFIVLACVVLIAVIIWLV
jgi:hypothetical protein